MSKNRFLKILLPSIALTFGSQAFAYTVHEAASHTLATSPDLLIQTNTREQVDKELRQAYSDYLPTLDMTAGWGEQYTNNPTTRAENPLLVSVTSESLEGTRTETRSEFGLIASQMLFDGFAVYHNVEGKKARVRAESWRVNSKAQEVALNSIGAFLKVILERELVKLNRENLAVHETIYGQIHKRSEGGIGRKADLDQAEARLAFARTNLMAEEGNLADAETEFLRIVGIPVPRHLETPGHPSPFPASEDEAVAIGLKRQPEFLASIEDVIVTKEEHLGARAPFVPRFNLDLGLNRNHNVDGTLGDTNDASAMLRMRWNLFNGGRDLANICRTAYKMQTALEVEHRAHRQVVETIRLSWSNFNTAKRQLPSLRTHVDASIRTTEAYQKQFNIGQRTLLDLLDAQNEYNGARIALANAKITELQAMFRVLKDTGCLTDYLNIALPKQAEPRAPGVMDGRMRFFDKTSTLFD